MKEFNRKQTVQTTRSIVSANFFEDVYDVVNLIPHGRVTTYGAIAEYLGLKRSARMVGWAMNAVISNSDIPAWRVVNRDGLLTGRHHFDRPDAMKKLLEAEGIRIDEDQVVEFRRLFWNPSQELIG